MKKSIIVICCLFILGCQTTSVKKYVDGKPNVEALYIESQKNVNARQAFMELALENPKYINSPMYFTAASYAISSNKIEDAGFFFFAAQARGRYELFLHPSHHGGASAALGALRHTVGEVVNPAIMRPNIYSNIVNRLELWSVLPADDYVFPWEKSGKSKTNEEINNKAAEIKSSMLQFMKPMADLLNIPEYYEAFSKIQNYNLKLTYDQKKEQQHIDVFTEAKKIIVEIETRKGYDVFKSRFEKT